MSSRDKILGAIAKSQPPLTALPSIDFLNVPGTDLVEKFISTLTTIGGKVIRVKHPQEIDDYIKATIAPGQRVISPIPEYAGLAGLIHESTPPHTLQNAELGIIAAHFGVAENGALWVTEELLGQRVLPFICQHLAVILPVKHLVATMHEAYEWVGDEYYGFGTFIAGPSKTADIEQSLVLGAHGSRSMTVFLMEG